jgi:DNA polymerase epsilon subunit 2
LTLTSSALQELATFIGRHCGSGWREEGLAEKVLEEVARTWKNCNGGVIVDGTSPELKDILKTLEGNMSGGKIMSGPRGLSRQNSLMLEPTEDADHSKTRLGLRPTTTLTRDDSQASFGMSSIGLDEEPDDEALQDVRRWLKVIGAFEQPRYTYNVAKKHFEKYDLHFYLLIEYGTDMPVQNRFQTIPLTTSLAQDGSLPEQVQRDPPAASP